MEPKTLKQFLAEKRKADAQRPEVVMKTLETLTNVKDGCTTLRPLSSTSPTSKETFWPTRLSTASSWTTFALRSWRRIARR